MNCLITGINGFAGSHLAEYLLNKKLEVAGTVFPENYNQNITNILDRIQIHLCNLESSKDIEQIIKKSKPNIIFHLAGQSNVPQSWKDPISTININILGTLYLLDSVKKYSPASKILIVCSAEQYDHSNRKNTIDENTPFLPQNPYAVTKACTDLLCEQLGKYYNLHIVRVRAFPHIGPRQSPNFVLSDFCSQIAKIEKQKQAPIIHVGNLENKRDFTDVRDMVHAYWLAIEKGKNGDVYNISSGKSYTIKKILKKLLQYSNTKIKIEIDKNKLRLNDTNLIIGNSRKFRNLTKWKPEIPIEHTIKNTLEWWRAQV